MLVEPGGDDVAAGGAGGAGAVVADEGDADDEVGVSGVRREATATGSAEAPQAVAVSSTAIDSRPVRRGRALRNGGASGTAARYRIHVSHRPRQMPLNTCKVSSSSSSQQVLRR